MSQIVTKFISDGAVLSGSLAAHGKIGSGAAALTLALFANGSGGTSFRAISGSDVSGGTLGVTDGSNLTNLSAANLSGVLPVGVTGGSGLSISGSQVSGGTFGAVNGSALTNLSAANLSGVLPVGVTGGSGLSIATSQLTGQTTLAQLPSIANDTILGNNSGSTGVPIALSVAQVNAILPVFTSALNGLAPASSGGSANFLR